jgi:hypothetical protein
MLDQDFCETLEYKISEALENISDEKVKGFWCDGVLLSEPDKYYSQKFINDNRQVKMKAYVGKDGQGNYGLTLKFGSNALSRYARNLDVAECIPKSDFEKWFSIDTSKQEIEIQLD